MAQQAFYLTGRIPDATNGVGFSGTDMVASNNFILTPRSALAIDSKIDDGIPGNGNVVAHGPGTNGSTCWSNAPGGVYTIATNTAVCNLYYTYKK